MIDNQIKIDFSLADKNDLYYQNGLVSHFTASVNSNEVILDYVYQGELNYDRIQLKLTGKINGKDIIEHFGLNPNIELPYQYPKPFELTNNKGDVVAVPHNQGVYLLQNDIRRKYLINYQTDKYQTSFFVDNLFVLVEDKGWKIVDLIDFKERSILFDIDKSFFINAVQISEQQIYIIIQDADTNQLKISIFDRLNFSIDNYSEYNLADLVETTSLVESLRYENETKLIEIPSFKHSSLIDSWRFIANNKWNSLIGRVEYWFQPRKDGEYFIRKEKYDFIELKIKTSANKQS